MSGFLSSFATFEEYRQSLYTIKRPNTSFIQEDNSIRVLDGRFDNVYSFGDVIFYDNILDKLEIVNGDNTELLQSFANNSSRYIPQALCVIPTGLLKTINSNDNKARFIALYGVNTDGSKRASDTTMIWMTSDTYINRKSNPKWLDGTSTTDLDYYFTINLSGLEDKRLVYYTLGFNPTTYPDIANKLSGSINNTTSFGSNYYAHIPVDYAFSGNAIFDENSISELHYRNNFNETRYYSLPLYYKNYELNPLVYNNTAKNLSMNYLYDINGYNNTQILKNLHNTNITFTGSWNSKHNTLGLSLTDTVYFYPAFACSEYETECFGKGMWYLPSIGELSLVMTRAKYFNNILQKIFGNTDHNLKTNTVYWSSTEYYNGYAALFDTSVGYISYNHKYNSYYVRAFLSL